VLSVGAASLAILLDLYAIRIIAFVLHRRVVAALALAACERDDDSVVLLGHCSVLEWAAETAPWSNSLCLPPILS